MLHFDCDYMEGAHPEILRRLVETNMEQTSGYGEDAYCERARELIREACGQPKAQVHFLIGGTQANDTVIDGILSHCQGVVAADTGHISVHESGAIESSGHKVLTLPNHNGKIDPQELEKFIKDFYADDTYPHMVAPGMVYISHPTEYGTMYSLQELEELHRICSEAKIPLFVDGARLIYGLAAQNSDVSLKDLARLADVFYIGGTKAGALFGEAVVFKDEKLIPRFFSLIKMHGALLAKGRLLGIQFETLFTDDLYKRIGEHAIAMAMKIKNALVQKGYKLYLDSPTNQQFVILPNEVLDKLAQNVAICYWEPRGEKESVVRFVTSWATKEENVDAFIKLL